MEGLSMMKVGIPAIDCCMGLKRPLTPCLTKDVCWSFPDIFWDLLSDIFSCFRMDLIFLQISFAFFVGSWLIYSVPSMIYPKIFFMGSRVPSS